MSESTKKFLCFFFLAVIVCDIFQDCAFFLVVLLFVVCVGLYVCFIIWLKILVYLFKGRCIVFSVAVLVLVIYLDGFYFLM